jgi:hypothetical protein
MGFMFPGEAFSSLSAFTDHATRVLLEWPTKQRLAFERVAQTAQAHGYSDAWARKAGALVEEVFRCGLRRWAVQVAVFAIPVHTLDELQGWCSLQFYVIESCPLFSPKHTFLRGDGHFTGMDEVEVCFVDELPTNLPEGAKTGTLQPLQEDELLREALPFLATAYPDLRSAPETAPGKLEQVVYAGPLEGASRQGCPAGLLQGIVELAFDYVRHLAEALRMPSPPYAGVVQDAGACRRELDRVVNWCREVEQTTKRPEDSGGRRTTGADKGSLQSWTQPDLDAAIRKYKAERAERYGAIRVGVRRGLPGAKKAAQAIFGRNAIAKALKVRARAMVSKSEEWKQIADELELPGTGRRAGAGRMMQMEGFDIAAEKAAVQQGNPTLDNVLRRETTVEAAEERGGSAIDDVYRRETIKLLRKSRLPEPVREQLHRGLVTGEKTDDQVREILKLSSDQRNDDFPRITR